MLQLPRGGAEWTSAVLMTQKIQKPTSETASPARLVYRCTQAVVASSHLLCDALIGSGHSTTRETRTLKEK